MTTKSTNYEVKERGGAYYLFCVDGQLGYASRKADGRWWWAGQLPGRRSGRKGFESAVDCIASGSGVRKGLIRKLVEDVT